MLNRLSTWSLVVLCIVSVGGCGGDDDDDAPVPSAFRLRFAANAAGQPVGCSDAVSGLGPAGDSTIGASDLRFYVSNLQLLDAAGDPVAHELDDDEFQYASDAGAVSLIDLTGNTEGTCASSAIAFAEGTARTNDSVHGTTLVGEVAAVSFDLGVPPAVMKEVIGSSTIEAAPSPLNEMYWTWATGYRYFVFNFAVTAEDGSGGDGYVHVGSRDCGPEDGLALEDRPTCDFPNIATVSLTDFHVADDVVAVDVERLLRDVDFVSPVYDQETFEVIGEGPGVECHSSPMQPDCSLLFDSLGLDIDSGEASGINEVFVRQ